MRSISGRWPLAINASLRAKEMTYLHPSTFKRNLCTPVYIKKEMLMFHTQNFRLQIQLFTSILKSLSK